MGQIANNMLAAAIAKWSQKLKEKKAAKKAEPKNPSQKGQGKNR